MYDRELDKYVIIFTLCMTKSRGPENNLKRINGKNIKTVETCTLC